MTAQARLLTTPEIDIQVFASRATARASHASTLAELATDAAGGHPSQRWSLSRCEDSTRHWFYESSSTAEWLVVRAAASQKGGTFVAGAGADLTLTITDGTTTANLEAEGIPDGLRGDRTLAVAVNAGWDRRLNALGVTTWYLDLTLLRSLLGAATTWRFELVIATGATAYLEHFEIEELPRFLVDTADTYGQLPQNYLPRGVVRDGASGLTRIGATLDAALTKSRRTYHAMTRDVAAPWTTTSTSYVALTGDDEPGGAATTYVVRPRRIRGDAGCPVKILLRYRLTGATGTDKAYVRLTTGGSGSPFVCTLARNGGAWTDAAAVAAALLTSDASHLDTLQWHAKVDAGTLELVTRVLIDDPV